MPLSRVLIVAGLGLCVLIGIAAVPRLRQSAFELVPPRARIFLLAKLRGIAVDHDVSVRMADGTSLVGSLYLPDHGRTKAPTILIRLPYGRLAWGEGYDSALFFARQGYSVLVQDLRGTGDSGGELLPWQDAEADGVATLAWIRHQPWSTGRVGTFGCSALGETQFVLARANDPSHAAMIASGAGGAVGAAAGRYSYFGLFEGGVLQLASGFGWFVNSGPKRPEAPPARAFDYARHLRDLPVASLVQQVRPAPNGYDDFLATPLGDPAWERWGYLADQDRIGVPAFVINTWGDQTVGDSLAFAEQVRQSGQVPASKAQRVVIAPGRHCGHMLGWSEGEFGDLEVKNAAQPYADWYLRWFDYWLRDTGKGLADLAPYTFFVLGENRWRSADQWPPREASMKRLMLGSGGHANSRRGDGTLAPALAGGAGQDSLRYDPANPVPSRGGPICCTGNPNDRSGPVDQADVEEREDVLVYTSAPLEEDQVIAGPVKAHLRVSSTARDTDFVARLVDVWPDGRAINIQEGALRVRYRDGVRTPRLMEAGVEYPIEVDMRSIAYLVPRGHRIRLDVTSSSFPRLDRNLNTGGPIFQEVAAVVALNSVHYGTEQGSSVEYFVLR